MIKIGIAAALQDPANLVTWARRVDAGPFTSIGVNDRLVYDSPEPMVLLGGMATATTRIQVRSEVLLAALRDPVLIAKQAATIDRLAGGRLSLGLAVGAREDDFRVVGADFGRRGRVLDEQLATMRRIWSGQPFSDDIGPIGPAPVRAGGPEILFGGFTPAAVDRVGCWGDGFICSGMPDYAKQMFELAEQSWQAAGRAGRPRLIGQINTAFGPPSMAAEARSLLLEYYGFLGDMAVHAADAILTTADEIRETIAQYEELGADEVMLGCWSPDIDQLDRLADLVGDKA
jgi:alkanesulfonate monooxygenase SsuD/methylene tetrahydromethanopterin reductase-like flavin-dependent oxidoreductase (luciferase family)